MWDGGRDGVWDEDQRSVPPPAFSAPVASGLNQTVATEELIKATGCTTEPLYCDFGICHISMF